MPATICAPSGTSARSLLSTGEADPRTAEEINTNATQMKSLSAGSTYSSLSIVADTVCDVIEERGPMLAQLIRFRALCRIQNLRVDLASDLFLL